MPTEAQRGIIRVGSNYLRLFSTLAFGIALVPLLSSWLGAKALGLFFLLLSQAGLASLFRDIVQTSLTRELASAWHAQGAFRPTAAAANLVSLGAGGITVLTFAVMILVLPLLQVPPEFLWAARWILLFEGLFTLVFCITAAATSMFIVREEFILQNIFIVGRRSDFLVSVLICGAVWSSVDPGWGMLYFSAIAVGVRTSVVLVSIAVMWIREPALMTPPWRARREQVRKIMSTFGWNSGVTLATNMHDRVGTFIVNYWFGLLGNAVFGLALRLVSYVRQFTIGMTAGVEAVGARLSSNEDNADPLRRMLRTLTRMHGLMAWPAVVVTFLLAEDLLRLWIGRSIENADEYIDMAAMLVRIMVLGLAARAISDGWVFLLYGAGFINRYARTLFVGGIVSPVLAIVLVMVMPDLGERVVLWNAIAGPSWAIAICFFVFHGILLPLRGAAILKISPMNFFGPLLPSLLVAVAAAPLLYVPTWMAGTGTWSLLDLGVGAASYAVVYGVIASMLLLSSEERRRLIGAVSPFGSTGKAE
ncbi:MAG: oligosaccharide flippase family protein [Phycisphaerales bacterium]|jgi:O-antigen/teichoic acid export membrane protein|nr:oligosaccharide flippase family protein [Phycisphaerales bacterium]